MKSDYKKLDYLMKQSAKHYFKYLELKEEKEKLLNKMYGIKGGRL